MNKISLIISFVVMFVLSGNAQTASSGKAPAASSGKAPAASSGKALTKNVRVGLKIGPSIDWASSGSPETESKAPGMGLNMGLILDYYLTDYFAVSSGLNFNAFCMMRYRFTDYRIPENFLEETNVWVLRRLKGCNLEIPVKVKGKFNVVDSFDAFVEVGCGLGFNLKDRCKDEFKFYGRPPFADEFYVDCTNQYRAFQPSLLFGVGAEYEINSKLSAFVQLTFDHAFTNAFVKSLEKQTGSIVRNNYIGIEVGIMH